MISIEVLEERINHLQILNESQHKSMTDKNDSQHSNMMDKLDSIHTAVTKDLMSHSRRVDVVEKETEKNKSARIWLVAIATFLALCIPIVVGLIF